MGDSHAESQQDSYVVVWINERAHRSLCIAHGTTCARFGDMIAELLHVPHLVRPYFTVCTTINGKDQGEMNESALIMEIERANKARLSDWGKSYNNSFHYRLHGEAITDHMMHVAHAHGDNLSSHAPIDLPRPSMFADRRGIGHQRSKSSPAVTTGIERGLGNSIPQEKDTKTAVAVEAIPKLTAQKPILVPDEKSPLEKRSLTPTPNRELNVPLLEEKDEAKLGISAAPHLEPRFAAPVSPSPPRASLKMRSKTISITLPGLPIKSTSAGPSPLPSPTIPRAASPSPRARATWDESLPRGGSLGRSHGNTRRRTAMNMFDTEVDITGLSDASQGRSASPPPPRQRFTPPPTILSPMVASIIATPASTSSPSTRQRAQTIGSKVAPQKWVKVRATKPLNAVHSDGRILQTWDSTDVLHDLLFCTLDRLKTET